MGARTGVMRVDWPTFWGAIFFLTIGGGFALFGGYQLATTYHFMQNASPVPAVVTQSAESCDDDGCTWWPTLVFTDAGGQQTSLRTRHGASNYGWSEGSEITVLHNPGYGYLRIPGIDNLYLLGGAFFTLGMLPVVIAIWLLFTMTFNQHRGDAPRED